MDIVPGAACSECLHPFIEGTEGGDEDDSQDDPARDCGQRTRRPKCAGREPPANGESDEMVDLVPDEERRVGQLLRAQ